MKFVKAKCPNPFCGKTLSLSDFREHFRSQPNCDPSRKDNVAEKDLDKLLIKPLKFKTAKEYIDEAKHKSKISKRLQEVVAEYSSNGVNVENIDLSSKINKVEKDYRHKKGQKIKQIFGQGSKSVGNIEKIHFG